ncbi:MAG: hypothetical protein DRR19_09880 [Candidatus Parabeggiatoa sp. nov. 1]|nr:MAG: hypothetical protein DRR19_09880 [Gammaproteobacteria bacterium]
MWVIFVGEVSPGVLNLNQFCGLFFTLFLFRRSQSAIRFFLQNRIYFLEIRFFLQNRISNIKLR